MDQPTFSQAFHVRQNANLRIRAPWAPPANPDAASRYLMRANVKLWGLEMTALQALALLQLPFAGMAEALERCGNLTEASCERMTGLGKPYRAPNIEKPVAPPRHPALSGPTRNVIQVGYTEWMIFRDKCRRRMEPMPLNWKYFREFIADVGDPPTNSIPDRPYMEKPWSKENFAWLPKAPKAPKKEP